MREVGSKTHKPRKKIVKKCLSCGFGTKLPGHSGLSTRQKHLQAGKHAVWWNYFLLTQTKKVCGLPASYLVATGTPDMRGAHSKHDSPGYLCHIGKPTGIKPRAKLYFLS